jgi:hypothetical protein
MACFVFSLENEGDGMVFLRLHGITTQMTVLFSRVFSFVSGSVQIYSAYKKSIT